MKVILLVLILSHDHLVKMHVTEEETEAPAATDEKPKVEEKASNAPDYLVRSLCVYVYVYVCMYVCMCVYVCMCMCVCVVCVCVCVCTMLCVVFVSLAKQLLGYISIATARYGGSGTT